MTRVPITRAGYRRLLRELTFLRRVVRPQVLDDLREARAFGVSTDNQQYLLARERWLVLDRKIRDLEEKVARCEIFVGRRFITKQMVFGAICLLQNVDTGQVHSFQLVGPQESDAANGRLAIDSPLGAALLGRREGEEVLVTTPGGLRTYRLLAIDLPLSSH